MTKPIHSTLFAIGRQVEHFRPGHRLRMIQFQNQDLIHHKLSSAMEILSDY